jgi:outer membrane protein OmpA-like peptidoglycan-associated protein
VHLVVDVSSEEDQKECDVYQLFHLRLGRATQALNAFIVAAMLLACTEGCSPRATTRVFPTDGLSSTPSKVSTIVRTPGDARSFAPIYFGENKTVLTPEALSRLYEVGGFLNSHPDQRITIVGHADDGYSQQYADWISANRAQTVAKFLINLGVSEERVQIQAKGRLRPVKRDCGTDKACHGLNRRVEFVVEAR